MSTLTHIKAEEVSIEPPRLMEPYGRSVLYGMLLQMEFPPYMIEDYYQRQGRNINEQNSEVQMNEEITRFLEWSEGPKYSCLVCLNDLTSSNQMVLKCGHKFCKSCLTTYLNSQISSRRVEKICCMQYSCSYVLTREDIRNYTNEDVNRRYERFLISLSVSKNPNVRWCVAPNCQHYVYRKKDYKMLVCYCGQYICYNCGQQWHTNSCYEHYKQEYSKIVDNLHLQYETMLCRKCPKCGLHVEKISGCNHMRCSKCNYQFCWLCLGRYSEYHYKPWNILGCPRQQQSQSYWKGWKYIFMVLFVPIMAIVLSLLLLSIVLIGVFGGIIGPIAFIHWLINRKLSVRSLWKKTLLWIGLLIVAIIIYPFSVLGFTVPGSCFILYDVLKKLT